MLGMAGPFLKYLSSTRESADIEIIPGLSASQVAASQLGAPINGGCMSTPLCLEKYSISDIRKVLEGAIKSHIGLAIYMLRHNGEYYPEIYGEKNHYREISYERLKLLQEVLLSEGRKDSKVYLVTGAGSKNDITTIQAPEILMHIDDIHEDTIMIIPDSSDDMEIIHCLMLGGCREQFVKFQDYHSLKVSVFATGQDLTDAISTDLNCFEVDISDYRSVLDNILKNHLDKTIKAIFSFTELGLETASLVAEALDLQCNPLGPVLRTRNKLLMRSNLERVKPEISIPYILPETKEQFDEFLALHKNIILKPFDGSGSAGVISLREGDGDISFDSLKSNLICEKYIEGKEYSIDAFSSHGIHNVVAIAEKKTTLNAPYVELEHILPAEIDSETKNNIEIVVTEFLKLIGHIHGPSHTEVKVNGSDIIVVESQTRFGGDRIWELIELATGFDLVKAYIEEVLLGRKYRCSSKNLVAAIKFFVAKPGVIKSIFIPENLSENPNIIKVLIAAKEGQHVKELKSSLDRLGYGIVVSDTHQGARHDLEALNAVDFRTCAGDELKISDAAQDMLATFVRGWAKSRKIKSMKSMKSIDGGILCRFDEINEKQKRKNEFFYGMPINLITKMRRPYSVKNLTLSRCFHQMHTQKT